MVQGDGFKCVSATMHVKFQQLPINSGWFFFSSSTEWWFLPLCYRDWYAQCQLCCIGLVIDVPVAVQCQVHSSRSSWSLTSLSWRRGRFIWSRAADHRDFPIAVIDTVVVVCCVGPAVRSSEETVEIPQLQPVFLDPIVHARCVQRQLLGRCSGAVRRFSRPCDHAATFAQWKEVPQFQFSPLMVDIPVVQHRRLRRFQHFGYGGDECGFPRIFRIFRAPPVVPELSASFSSFRAHTTVSARGLQGVPESPGV